MFYSSLRFTSSNSSLIAVEPPYMHLGANDTFSSTVFNWNSPSAPRSVFAHKDGRLFMLDLFLEKN